MNTPIQDRAAPRWPGCRAAPLGLGLALGLAWIVLATPGCTSTTPANRYAFARPQAVASQEAGIVRNTVPRNREDFRTAGQ